MISYQLHRVSLQKHLSPSTGEGILCDEAGRLLEGFITNLFIVTGDSHQAGCKIMKHNFGLSCNEVQAVSDGARAGADDGEGGHQVATAAVQDGVLPGIMRAHVIKVPSFALQNDDLLLLW